MVESANSIGMSKPYSAAAIRENGGGRKIIAELVQANVDAAAFEKIDTEGSPINYVTFA